MLVDATQASPRQQWEVSSVWSQAWNCGVTAAAFIAGFYKDTRPFIEEGRRLIDGFGPYNVTGTGLVYGAPPRTPTTAWQQADILRRRGVAVTVRYLTNDINTLHALVDSGRRPILVGIYMARVAWNVRGHDFTGWHAIVIMKGVWLNGVRGFLVNDPNFPAGSSESVRFYSDAVMSWALLANEPRWSVVPDYPKLVVLPDTSTSTGALTEMAWIHMVHFYARPVQKRIIASPGSPTDVYKGPGRTGYGKPHARLTHDTFRLCVGTVTIPTGQTNAGIWFMFQEGDGVGAFFAPKSRVRTS